MYTKVNKYIKLHHKRHREEQINVSMRFIINLFHLEDQHHIRSLLYFCNQASLLMSPVTVFFIMMTLGEYVNTYVLTILFVILQIFKTEHKSLKEIARWVLFMHRSNPQKSIKLYVYLIVISFSKSFLLLALLPYFCAIVLFGYINNRFFEFGVFALSSSLILVITFFIYYVLISLTSFKLKHGNFRQSLQLICMKEERGYVVKNNQAKQYALLFKRLFTLNNKHALLSIVCFAMILLEIVGYILFLLVQPKFIPYFLMLVWTISPIYIYFMHVIILFKDIYTDNYLLTSYYMTKKLGHRTLNNKALVAQTILALKAYVLPFFVMFILGIPSIINLGIGVLNVLHCCIVVSLKLVRLDNYLRISFDDLAGDVHNNFVFSVVEDQILMYLPLVLLSYNILNYIQTGSMFTNFLNYLLFICASSLYCIVKIVIVGRRKNNVAS